MTPEPKRHSKEWVLPAGLIVLTGVALVLAPGLTALIALVAPAPIIFLHLMRGRGAAGILIALVFTALTVSGAGGQALAFLGGDAVLAFILAETILLRWSFDKCLLAGALGSALISIFVMLMAFSGDSTSPVDYFQKEIEKHSERSLKSFEQMGESQENLQAMRDFSKQTSRQMAMAFPVFITLGALAGAILNYSLVRALWTRLYGPEPFNTARFVEWVFPEQFVWVLIGSAVAFFFIGGGIGVAGMNVFFAMLTVYFFQGLAVVAAFFRSRKVPVFLWVVMIIVVLIQPILIGLVAGVGVFDIWIDFRKLRVRQEPGDV